MTKTVQIEAKQMVNLVKDCRDLINDYIKRHEMSVHGFAKKCEVHPNQMYLFLNADRGLNLTTMQRVGIILSED